MIISHRYRYIFLKTNKTAGTSVEIALSRFCGEADIITPISPEDEMTRRQNGYPGPRNFRVPGAANGGYYNHITASEIVGLLDPDIWDSYFKFSIERNPWDRVISMYYWKCQSEPRPSLSEFLTSGDLQLLKSRGIDLYSINGEVAVDQVCRYERLQEDLDDIAVRLGFPDKLELPRAKSRFRKDRRPYREVYSDLEREHVAQVFADEIRLFGYQF